MRLRTRLFQLTLGTVIPPIALAVLIGVLLIQDQHEAFRRGALDRNRAFMTAVDVEIRGHMTSLQALASSKALETGDLRAFYEEAQRVHRSQPDWLAVVLSDSAGNQLMNTLRPFGEALPRVNHRASAERVLQTGKPAVGDVTLGSRNALYGVPIRIPVMHGTVVDQVLTAVVDPAAFERLIALQQLPSTWISGLVDASGHFIARVPPLSPADSASDVFRAATAKAAEGWYRGRTVENLDTYTAHKTSSVSGWTVGVAIPSAEVNAAAYHAGWLVGLGAVATIALALFFAWWIGRRITTPIASLAASARTLGRTSAVMPLPVDSGIEEVSHLAAALAESSVAIHERQALIEREQTLMRAADRAKDEFLAMLGHELRNPLSAVSNAAALLGRPDLPAQKRSAVQAIIARQTEQLTRLVNDLLDVGRVVSGKIHLEKHIDDLCDITRAAVSAINATGRAGAHRIAIDAPAPTWVEADRARLEQVVTNLVSNAVDHTPEDGSIRIAVTAEDGSAVLSVADTGVGFRDEDREAIFDLFYQADKGLHRKGGLGIGLTLVRRLVEMHGGTVSASSEGPGTGATFTVRLPLGVGPALAAPPVGVEKASAEPLDILVIDDSEDVRLSMRMVLEAEGHRVQVAPDGESGVRAALTTRPAIALVDIGMPGMDGYAVAREIRRQIANDIALVAMTGYGQAADVRHAIEAGFDAHVVKPADLPALNALLARLGRRAATVRSPLMGD